MSLYPYTKEFKKNFAIAYPVMLGQIGHVLVGLADNIMVGRLGAAHLAAVSLANSILFIAMSFGIGFTFAITPLIAEADGARDSKTGTEVLDHGVLMALILGVILFLLMILIQPLLNNMNQPQEVVALALPYFRVISLSIIPLLVFQGLKQFADGLSLTKYAMQVTIVANVANVIINYLLIYGYWVFPRMEIVGAGIGTLVSRVLMVYLLFSIFRSKPKLKTFLRPLSISNLNKLMFRKLFHLGYPTAFQMFFEVTIFTAVVLMAGTIGVNEQAANQIALNLAALTFMVAVGLGVTATVRVGNQLGKRNYKELKRIGLSVFLLMLMIDSILAMAFILSNKYLPWIYIDDLEVVKIASGLIIIAGLFQLSDGFQAVVLGGLRGLQDVKIPMYITFISYWVIGFPVCYFLGFQTDLGVDGLWYGLLIALTSSAVLLFIRFNHLTHKLISNSLA